MRKFQENRTWKDIMRTKPILILLGTIVLVIVWSDIRIFIRMQETAENKRIEEQKINELKYRKEMLTRDIEKLKSDSGIEENIRNKFGYVKEGEGVVVIVDEKTKEEDIKKKGGFFEMIINFFRKK